MNENKELDLYAQDFESESIWHAICEAVGVDGLTEDHIVIEYIKARKEKHEAD